MGRTVESLLHEAMELTPGERGQLAEELFHSLQSDEERAIEQEWLAVAERRSAEIDAGSARTLSLEEAIANARRGLTDAAVGTPRRS
jgi:putative addiction module component (TIGR02574 family)